MIERLPRDALVPLRLVPVCGLHHKAEFDRPHLSLIHAFPDFVARARGPGEVMDVVAVIGYRLGIVRIVVFLDLHSARTYDLILRNC